MGMNSKHTFTGKIHDLQMVRLVEDKTQYECLAIENNFSDEEITVSSYKNVVQEINN